MRGALFARLLQQVSQLCHTVCVIKSLNGDQDRLYAMQCTCLSVITVSHSHLGAPPCSCERQHGCSVFTRAPAKYNEDSKPFGCHVETASLAAEQGEAG